MRLPATLLIAAPLAVLAGCGTTNSAASPASAPEGVVEQYSTLESEIEERGGETENGPWTIGYIVEGAEPWFEGAGSETLREPEAGETHHIEVIPRETETGRIIPDVPVRVEVVDADGKVVDSQQLNFLYSTFFHYANNFSVPEEGTYSLRVSIEPPTFYRHGEAGEEPALSEPATVTFEDVELGAE